MKKASKIYVPPIPVLRKLMNETKAKRSELAEYIGVSSVAVGQYYNGEALPAIDKLIKIADFFNVSTDYLLGRADVKTTDTNKQKICEYLGLSEETANKILQIKEHSSLMQCFNLFMETDSFGSLLLRIDDYLHTRSKKQILQLMCIEEFLKENDRYISKDIILDKGLQCLTSEEQELFELWYTIKWTFDNVRKPYPDTGFSLYLASDAFKECMNECFDNILDTDYDTTPYFIETAGDEAFARVYILSSPFHDEVYSNIPDVNADTDNKLKKLKEEYNIKRGELYGKCNEEE